MTGGSWDRPAGAHGGSALLGEGARGQEAPLQFMDLLGQDTLLRPGQVPATPQLSQFLAEPLILQHKLLQHPTEVPLGPGRPGSMGSRCPGVHLLQLEPQVTVLLLELQQLSLCSLGWLYCRGLPRKKKQPRATLYDCIGCAQRNGLPV